MDNPAAELKAKDVIEAILDNMRQGLEPLVTRTLAPSIYEVRLHADDLDRLKGILGDIEADSRLLLDRRLARLNRGPLPAWVPFQGKRRRYESAEDDWFISFQEDPDGTLERGQIEVASELAAEPSSESSGTKTQLISTSGRRRESTTRRIRTDTREVYAKIAYQDDSGRQLYRMTKKQLVIGRGAVDTWTDLCLATKPDVSRQHAYIKYEPGGRRFLIKDMSSFGTTVDGNRIEPSIDDADGEKRDLDRWAELPDRARIGLADVIVLDFERVV